MKNDFVSFQDLGNENAESAGSAELGNIQKHDEFDEFLPGGFFDGLNDDEKALETMFK